LTQEAQECYRCTALQNLFRWWTEIWNMLCWCQCWRCAWTEGRSRL